MTPPRNRYERILALLLRLDAVLLLTALMPAVMPFAWMKDVHRCLGMGELPDGPILGYLTRSLSLVYATHGAVLWFVSLDVRRFLPLIRFLASVGILFGLGLTALDIVVGMPLFWVVSEGPCIFLFGCLVFWLTGHVEG